MIHPFFMALILLFSITANANTFAAPPSNKNQIIKELLTSPKAFVTERVQENDIFYGLASYYNNVNYYVADKESMRQISENDTIELKKNQWLAIVGRFNVLLIYATKLSAHLDEKGLVIDSPDILSQPSTIVTLTTKPVLPTIAPELGQIRYAHLWSPLASLTKIAESSLISIHDNIITNWGGVIVLFSIILKFLLLPVSIMTVRFQRKVSQVQSQLTPLLAEIKANYNGEEAHNRLMAEHKKVGVSPFYTLKPMLGSFIQIPILIAVFNALGEMPQFNDQPFLWINNLAYPDAIFQLPLNIPMFGNTINLLPFIMSTVTLFATATFQNSFASATETKKQKRNLYLMTAAFFILFYPFPAAMVLYWTMNNILHSVQQQIIKI